MTDEMNTRSVDSLADFLLDNGIPSDFVTVFVENQIDGESFLELTEVDVKEMVKPIGVVKKVVKLQREAKSDDKDTSGDLNIETSLVVEPSDTPNQSFSSRSSTASESSLTTLSTSTPKSSLFPSSFSIPSRWRPSIMNAIHARTLTKDIRNEIARDLVTHMYGSLGKPTAKVCCFVAQQLILKYPFMSDCKGTGYGSWEQKLCERVNNVRRKRKTEGEIGGASPVKRGRPKKSPVSLQDRYPTLSPGTESDSSANESNLEALAREMRSLKPRSNAYIPLMKATFMSRRQFILTQAVSVVQILETYPALKQTCTIEQEMELVVNRSGMFHSFSSEWRVKWVPSIILYCKTLKRKKEVGQVISSYKDDSSTGDESDEKCALSLLALLFAGPKKKAVSESSVICYLYEKFLIGEDPDVIARKPPLRNSPWIAEFSIEDGENVFYIMVEQKAVCQTMNFTKALYVWFSLHYVFHLCYEAAVKDICMFFQEFIFGLPCTAKRTSGYLSTATDIQAVTVR